MTTKPLISVVVPVYNGEKYLEETLHSIVTQEDCDFELIVIDGASSDSTLEIAEKFSDNISFLVAEPDNGQADAINKVMATVR